MEEIYEKNVKHRLWKKALCVLLSVIIAFGTFIALTVGSSRLQDWLGIQSMLSAYAAEIVDTKGALSVDEESMLADNTLIELENRDGSNTVYLFSEPISFTDKNGNIKTKDISVERQSDKELKNKGYEYTNGQNDYRINFSEDSSKGLLVQFDDCNYSIVPQGKYSVTGKESVSEFLNEKFETFEYNSIYGVGTNLKFYPQLNGVKDEIVLSSNIGQAEFSFELKTENCCAVLNDDGTVSLISNNDKSNVQTFSAPFAYDSEYVEGDRNEHYTDCSYSLDKTAENTYTMTVAVDKDWLNSESTVYPIVIDPTTSHIGNMYDLPIHTKRKTVGASVDNNAVGTSTENGTSRSLIKFQKPSEIKAYAKINSAYYWTRELTGRTSSFKCGVYKITSSWNENSLWSTRPTYNGTMITSRNINSTSTDAANNPYWYKFNITALVQQWYTGTTNYGFMMKYEDETNTTKNLRTFAHLEYSSSSWRPYTVINYTNDTTAPTVTSVTGNPTSWTKNNVTLTVNGATDNSGGAGLHSTPYSFSTTKGSYSWQSGNTKAFSSNCTVYVYVRDALGNVRLVSTQTISKIDKTAPTAPKVTGAPTDWTNKDITLTADSSDSASGVSSYSFSTTKGSYSWQTGKTKTVSANTTYYVYSKDNAGNISAATTVTVSKIDKTSPTTPTVTGNTDNWTNGNIELTAQSTDNESGIFEYSFSNKAEKYNWQKENTYTSTEKEKIYVCSKDTAGNISEPEIIDLKIDKLSPTGSVTATTPTDWVRSVTITADASDEISGLHELPYSFSTEEGVYSWQAENTKTLIRNGTYYIYARDYAENITLLDTITIDKIDSTAPTINDINIKDADDKTIITIDATDDQSGIAQYSIDGGKTWQMNNIFEITKDSLNYIAVMVKDNLDNCTPLLLSKYYDFYKPQLYYENGKLGMYSPNPNCQCEIYYKFAKIGSWIKYEKPITVPPERKTIYLSFYQRNLFQAPEATKIEFKKLNKFAYTEGATDLSLTYNSVTFNINRNYADNKWSYSYDSCLNIIDNGSLIEAQMTDFNNFTFVKQGKYKYINESNGYEISVAYDENDEKIVEYILKYNDVNYHYNLNGQLIKISNAYGDLFNFTRTDNRIIIKDGAGRTTAIALENSKISSITDANGGIINYYYDGENLVKVVDQAGVIIGRYEYTDNKLSKTGDKSIIYDSEDRVTEYLYDNGYSIKLEYSDNTITTTTSDEKKTVVTYNDNGNITSSTDENGSITTYTYDDEQRLIKVEQAKKIVNEYSYDDEGRLISQKDSDNETTYLYDDNGRVIKQKNSNETTYYTYDENGKVIQTHTYPVDEGSEESVIKYTYENGLLIKAEDENNKSETMYTYDVYGNTVTTSSTKENDDGTTSIGVTNDTYDILGRLVSTSSDDSETVYTYDAAGRTLLVNADGEYSRTVYDSLGRTVQEIDNDVYNPDLDNLPNAYSDSKAGHTYVYSDTNNLISETNKYGITTTYEYSDIGTLYKKHFDIYDYYYLINGKYDKIDVSGKTIVNYYYNVTDSSIELEEGQYIRRAVYADGYVEEQKVDENDSVYERYANGEKFYSVSSSTKSKLVYYDSEINHRNTITSSDNKYSYLQQTDVLRTIFNYSIETNDEIQTINETHFNGKEYQSVVSEDSITFTTSDSVINYNVNEDDNSSTEQISSNGVPVLSSSVSYNENNDVLKKSYNINNILFTNTYDDNGNIIDDENNHYVYNDYGQLISTTGTINSSYTYDNRGNILSKTVNGNTVSYEYGNTEWKDQLTSVNGVDLTYDANGNLTSYGDRQYTWSHGKRLLSITVDQNSYFYHYDASGIRSSKIINGVTTNFDTLNGKILAQYDETNNIYFQYNGDTPIGFILNDVQYFYITNLSGDVIGIADAEGTPLVEYVYDEWGKLLKIYTAEEGNEEQIALANANPLRYRGYYYDTETGYYYLQSRYYDPELCRFISANSFEYIDTSNLFSSNAYIYCWNCPVTFDNAVGNVPEVSIDLSGIWELVSNIDLNISEHLQERFEKLQSKFNAFAEKTKFYLQNPDVLINKTLSKLLGHEVNLKFRIIHWIKENINVSNNNNEDNESAISSIKLSFDFAEDEKTDNWLVAVFKVLSLSIQLNTITEIFEGIMKIFNPSFNFNDWFEDSSELIQDIFSQISLGIIMVFNKLTNYIKNYLNFDEISEIFKNKTYSEIGEWMFESFTNLGGNFFNLWENFANVFNGYMDGTYRGYQGIAVFASNAAILAITILIPEVSPESVLLSTFLTNTILNFEIDFENGHFWG